MRELQRGSLGVFSAYGNTEIVRRVWDSWSGSKGLVYSITSEREYLSAVREGREPITVGFRAGSLIRRATTDDRKRRYDPQFPAGEERTMTEEERMHKRGGA